MCASNVVSENIDNSPTVGSGISGGGGGGPQRIKNLKESMNLNWNF